MLTGKALFRGETVSDILVEVLGKEPDLSALPAHARYVAERCLRKDPRKRWQAIGDVRIALEGGVPESGSPAPALEAKRDWLPWAIAGALLLVLTRQRSPPFRRMARACCMPCGVRVANRCWLPGFWTSLREA